MAVYKVPQDVEADDKLIGPFSFRQFVYLLIVAASLAIGFFLSRLFLPLAIVVLPIVLFFGALALPLRKDQPMETYLAALVSFYLKPRKRFWNPDGQQLLVEITAPKVIEVQRTKDISQEEAEQRLSYLANIVDSRGWAVRGVGSQSPESSNSVNTDVYFEAQQAPDMLDEAGGVRMALDNKLSQSNSSMRQNLMSQFRKQASTQTTAQQPVAPAPDSAPAVPAASSQDDQPNLQYNPYPSSIHQAVVQPSDPSHQTRATEPDSQLTTEPQSTSEKQVSPDIINLANNADLSVETIAREAHRIQKKEADDEVVISLR